MRIQGLAWASITAGALLQFSFGLAHAAPPTPSFAGKYLGETGEITLTSQPNGKLHVQFALQAVGLANMGTGDGEAVVKNGASSFTLDGYPSCNMALKFSKNGQLDVTQSGMSQECGFGANVTADGSYARSPTAPAAAIKPELSVAGAPSRAECKTTSKPKKQAANQLEINQQQAELATIAGCAMRAAYESLDKSVASKPGLADKLGASQAAWNAFESAHVIERFPHQDEQGYYGSMAGMCYGAEGQASYQTRTIELRGMQPCKASPTSLAKAQADAKAAELAMHEVLAKLRASYRGEAQFIRALGKAQQAFDAWRRAQAEYIEAVSGGSATCLTRELERMTRARSKQLGLWFKPAAQNDSCSGSYAPPSP